MLLREAGRDLIRDVAAPLWLLVNQTAWPGQTCGFDLVKCGASSILAHLAYCHITDGERALGNRATIVPSRVFQELVTGEQVDFIEALNSVDIGDVEVIETRSFVAVTARVRDILFIGVRGTAFAYDWLVNLKVSKAEDDSGRAYHEGFLTEARELRGALMNRVETRSTKNDNMIYLAGHSLGGAVASILNDLDPFTSASGCYIFGSPRISGGLKPIGNCLPFATRRYLDIVPHVPMRGLGYVDHPNQMQPDGNDFQSADFPELYYFSLWLLSLAGRQFIANHAMEQYRREVLDAVKKLPQISGHWRFADITL